MTSIEASGSIKAAKSIGGVRIFSARFDGGVLVIDGLTEAAYTPVMRLLILEIALWAAIIVAARFRVKRLLANIPDDLGTVGDDRKQSLVRQSSTIPWITFGAVVAVFLLFADKVGSLGPMFAKVEFGAMMLALFFASTTGLPLRVQVHQSNGSLDAPDLFMARIAWIYCFLLIAFYTIVYKLIPIAWGYLPSFDSEIGRALFFVFSLIAIVVLGVLAADLIGSLLFRLSFIGRRVERPQLTAIIHKQFQIAQTAVPELRILDASKFGFVNFMMVSHPFLDPILTPRIYIDSQSAEQSADDIEPLLAVLAATAFQREGLDRLRLSSLIVVAFLLPLILILHETAYLLGGNAGGVFNLAFTISILVYILTSLAWAREKIVDFDSAAISLIGTSPEALSRALESLSKRKGYAPDPAGAPGSKSGKAYRNMQHRIDHIRSGQPPEARHSLLRAVWKGRQKWVISAFYLVFAGAAIIYGGRHVHGIQPSDFCRNASGRLVPISSLHR